MAARELPEFESRKVSNDATPSTPDPSLTWELVFPSEDEDLAA
jgi:hypothetical protein